MEHNPFVESRRFEEGVILHLTAALEQYNAETIRQLVTEEIECEQPRWVILDCSEVPFVDSRGIGLCIKLEQQLRERDNRLYFAALNDHLRDAFRFTNLFTHFAIFDDLPSAVEAAHASFARREDLP